jgi:hypothetical protein
MGQTSWFGGSIQLVVDYTMKGPIERFFTNLAVEDGRI